MIVKTIPHSEPPYGPWYVGFEHQKASANIAILSDFPNYAFLYNVVSNNPRNGEGSALIREIDEYCIQHQIALIVLADPFNNYDRDLIQTREELKTWYEKNGAYFVEYDEDEGGIPKLLLGDWRD